MRRALFVLVLALGAGGQARGEPYSPPVADDYPRRLLWGDTHLHSAWSLDALLYNNYRVGPDEAYRFARGETVTSSSGQPVRLSRPLDFLVVADHAEFMATAWRLRRPDPELAGNTALAALLAAAREGFGPLAGDSTHSRHFFELSKLLREELGSDRSAVADTWAALLASAERFNEPGRFSTLLGYEWSSNPDGNNLHRVVVLRDGAGRAGQVLPFSSTTSEDPEDLWRWLEHYERDTGGRALAIPHNGNVSNGLMFRPLDFAGRALDAGYARARQRWEPLYEVTQMKGDAETHPLLSPEDDLADFERWDDSNIFFTRAKDPAMLPHEYARSSLGTGMQLERDLGVNPFRFGLIGSTDSHTGLATADEDNFWNKVSFDEPVAGRAAHRMSEADQYGAVVSRTSATISAAGYAAVWARENTREAVFDALYRREVYATTGPRIRLRLFAGWDFQPGDAQRADRDARGYRLGVPMGAELLPRPEPGKAPALLLYASKDPEGANLARLQLVKGWLDASGRTRERVIDVAVSPRRAVSPQGTVDLASATYSNSIGSAVLEGVWRDPDFDPALPAFYYARVVEIPTPRWTTVDAARFGTPLPREVPAVIRERAYSSPVWYRPAAERH